MIKKISLTALLFTFVFFCLSITALAVNDIEWVETQSSVKLYWGDSATEGDYVIKAEDFNNKSVFISISKDGNTLKNFPLSEGMEMECDDEIKVYAKTIDPNYETITENGNEFKRKGSSDPYAELNISVRGEPEFDITVETDKDTYDPKSSADSKIYATITVQNNGDAAAKNTVLTINTTGLELLNGKTEYRNSEIKKSESLKSINLTLKTPALWEDKEFNIAANITGTDIKANEFDYGNAKTISVEKKWNLIVSKSFPEESSFGETIPVSVSVRNNGLCDLNNIVLNDSIVSGMHLRENRTLNKTLSLKSGERAEKALEYSLIPESTGDFTLPLCVAVFTLPNGQREEISSNNSSDTITIYEPDVIVTKTVDKQQMNVGDNVTVTITAQNNKNVKLSVRVNDTLPPGAKLVAGETSLKQLLQSNGDWMSINYTIQMNKEGEIKLPACKANFTDVGKKSIEVSSDTPIVYVGSPISLTANNTTVAVEENGSSKNTNGNNSSSQTGNNSSGTGQIGSTNSNNGKTPGFDIVLSVIGFLGISGFLKKRNML
jgi:uncharacterized repeat protein (TIGR01451 family)